MSTVEGESCLEHTKEEALLGKIPSGRPSPEEPDYRAIDSDLSLESRMLPRFRNALFLTLLLTVSYFIVASCRPAPRDVMTLPARSLVKYQATSSTTSSAQPTMTAPTNGTVMRDFEVDPSVQVPSGVSSCQQTLMEFSFANSYGKPFVGKWQLDRLLQSIFLNLAVDFMLGVTISIM